MYYSEGSSYSPRSSSPSENRRPGSNSSYLYNVLGVLKSANQNQIRRAYKKKAMLFHPDKGGDLRRFQEVREAYEILSDPDKRSKYDCHGEREIISFQEIRTYTSSTPEQFFKTMDVKQKLLCSLEDLFSGKEVTIRINRKIVCRQCNGEGGSDGYLTVCSECDGTGFRSLLLGDLLTTVSCTGCEGRGCYVNLNRQCKHCNGECTVHEVKEVFFKVLPGMGTGSIIRLSGAGDEAPGLAAGDILLIVQEHPHHLFIRQGYDLQINMKVQLGEALCGFSRSFRHLDGREVSITCQPCEIQGNCVKVVKGEGMPTGKGNERGSLLVVFQVIFPIALNADSIQLIQKALSVPPQPSISPTAIPLSLEERKACPSAINRQRSPRSNRSTSLTSQPQAMQNDFHDPDCCVQ